MSLSSSPLDANAFPRESIHAAPEDFARSYCDFIAASPTAYHAAACIASILRDAGFTLRDEGDSWTARERKGFVVRDGAVIAWKTPARKERDAGVRIVGSHTDSPSFHLKPVVDTEMYGYGQVNVEVYGGPLLNSWLNRDLGLAGRLVTLDGDEKLVRTGAVMTIPQVAPHLDRSANVELKLSAQRDYHPIWSTTGGNTTSGSAVTHLADAAGVAAEQIAAMDIFAYDTQPPQVFGAGEKCFIAAGRQDNLSSVYAALSAFVQAGQCQQEDRGGQSAENWQEENLQDEKPHSATQRGLDTQCQPAAQRQRTDECQDIQIFAAFNNEEIGSRTYSGAAGAFLESVLRRLIEREYGMGSEVFERVMAHSSCLSADAGHAVNPNRPDLHDPAHQVQLGGGPMVKVHASGAYSSNAVTQALLARAARKAGVRLQAFVSHNDVPCGTTIGPLTATRLGIPTVDCGIPLLSMHSVRELSSPRDVRDLARLIYAYLEA
ncbi:MAG: M18 family aminopeptidase [Actinomycetaceae bacterium]|nr:M18 family aminopeptidase [Actinomycetaceae bacterium]MDY5855262.1 M18 family aminopeptidase [Arcanobacterium sp.]